MEIRRTRQGFTLVELLLYVGIASSLLLVSTLLMQTLIESRVKNQVVAEVEGQGRQVVQIVTQAIRNADAINAPAQGTSGAALSVNTYSASLNPTTFSLSSGVIQMKEGAAPARALTNARVTASALTFQNLSRAGTPGTVRVSFTLSYAGTAGRQEYVYQKTFYASATLRQP